MPQPSTLLVIDGNSLAHRAYHAYERSGLTDSDGKPLWGTYGFVALLAGICQKTGPDALIIGFDDQKGSLRRARCPEYKATRGEKTPELYRQMADIQFLLSDLGVSVCVPSGYEADDVLGSAAATAERHGWRCVIATSDRDSFSLISPITTVLRLLSGLDNAVWMTPDKLFETYGVAPHQYLDYAALRGDISDNLAGVMGIGEKTAAKILAACGSLSSALADLDKVAAVAGPAAAKRLSTDQARANISRNLDIMAIRRDLPIDLGPAQLRITSAKVRQILLAHELPSLVARTTEALCLAAATPLPGDAYDPF